MVNKEFEYRIDWIDATDGSPCCDWLSEEMARWEVQNDILGEIYSVTRIIDEEGNESENLLENFRNS